MADLHLDILVIPTYSKMTLGVADISTYPDDPPVVTSPSITIEIPAGFGTVTLPFIVEDFNVFTSLSLGLTSIGSDLSSIPDGVYTLTYSIAPAIDNFVTKTIMRTEIIQEKFDNAFMKLDMMECDGPIRKQAKETLSTINFFIQAAIASANECAIDKANTLYCTANDMLDRFIKNNCGCSGTNYLTNFV